MPRLITGTTSIHSLVLLIYTCKHVLIKDTRRTSSLIAKCGTDISNPSIILHSIIPRVLCAHNRAIMMRMMSFFKQWDRELKCGEGGSSAGHRLKLHLHSTYIQLFFFLLSFLVGWFAQFYLFLFEILTRMI